MLPNGNGHTSHQQEHKVNEGHVDPRVKRTRQLLIQAFVDLSNEKDFSAITVQDIAERATVNRATFYAHFEDKYALLNYYVRESYGTKIREGMGMSCSFTEANIRSLIVTTCEYLAETHSSCTVQSLQMAPQLRTQMQTLLYELLLRWLKSRPPLPTQRPIALEQIASTLSWAVFGAAIQWVTDEKKLPAEEMARQVVDLLMGGLAHYVDFAASAHVDDEKLVAPRR